LVRHSISLITSFTQLSGPAQVISNAARQNQFIERGTGPGIFKYRYIFSE
jgi:hypothetical protein